MLAAFRLEKFPNAKAILCAPTKPLIDQHTNTIKELMTLNEDEIIQLSGSITPDKRKSLWEKGRIIICTPQTLQNDIIQSRTSLENVVLLCLDEAHKSVGEHSYVFIAEQYHKKAKNPLLLGLTASPGADMDKLIEIKENLGVTNIEYRDEKSEDVKIYLHDIDEKWELIKLPEDFRVIINILTDLFRDVLSELKRLGIIDSAVPANNPRRELLKLRERVYDKYGSESGDNQDEFFEAMALVGNSVRLSHALELIETQGVSSLAKYLEGQINQIRLGKGSRALKNLMLSEEMTKVLEAVKKLQEKGVVHPKLEKLKEIIAKEVEKNPKNRILVFAHFRETAKTISNELNKLPTVRAHWFVGQSSMRGDKGLSQKEQIEIMHNFRAGKYNVLVSTSVAEEGLDIGECELVVFYDAVPSAIRLIQRKGRTGRRKKGKVIMLIAEGTRDEGYLWASRRQARKMLQLVRELERIKSSKTGPKAQRGLLEFITPKKSTQEVEEEKSMLEEVEGGEVGKEETQTSGEIVEPSSTELNKTELKIICDNRERGTTIIKELVRKNLHINFETLPVGDYICSDRVIVERKEVRDLIRSITDKRLFVQAKALVESCSNPILIIEGNLNLYRTSLNPAALAAAIVSIATDFNLPIIYTKNQQETAEVLFAIIRREQMEHKRSVSIAKRKSLSIRDQLEETVATFPHINRTLARRLLQKFGSLNDLTNAKFEDLVETRGIGEKIAEDLIDYIYMDYNSTESAEDLLDEIRWIKERTHEKEKY